MAIIRVVEQDIDGNSTITTQDVFQTDDVTFKINGVNFQAAVILDMEMELDGDFSSISDQCGRTENRRRGDSGWTLTIDGIVTPEEPNTVLRSNETPANLSLARLKEIGSAAQLEVNSLLTGKDTLYEVKNIVIKQSNDLIDIDVGDGPQDAIQFQLQLKQP